MSEIIQLQSGDWSVDIDRQGAALRRARWRDLDILRPHRAHWDGFEPLCQASFPLVPYSNRIRDGRFTFEGSEFEVPSFRPGDHHALHGVGWLATWACDSQGPDRVSLSYRHDGPAWPWRFHVTQDIAVEGDALVVTLAITNTDARHQPVGLGFHPYFPRDADTRLAFDATGVWTGAVAGLSERLADLPERWRFQSRRTLPEEEIDHCFTGWPGRARIDWPQSGLSVAIRGSEALDHAVVFIPQGQPYFCFEPVSHMSNAIHHLNTQAQTGLTELAQGEVYTVSMTLHASLS